MKYQDVADPTPGEGEAVVRIQAAGVNYTDVYSRAGINPGPPLPRTIGVEGAGVVVAVGSGVSEVAVGDEVVYCSVNGSYAEQALVPAWRLVKRPAGLDAKAGAAAMLQGMTAHYLCNSTYAVQPGRPGDRSRRGGRHGPDPDADDSRIWAGMSSPLFPLRKRPRCPARPEQTTPSFTRRKTSPKW